MGSVLLERP